MLWQKVTIIGIGLLGGSLGLAIRQRQLALKVDGLVRRTASIAECEKCGVADHITRDLARAVENADLIILCTPLAQMKSLVQEMLPYLRPGAIVTDVGSVKGTVVRDLEPLLLARGVHFVGSHPMAGSEKTGVSAARADLFHEAICVVTPTATSQREAVRKVEEFWRAVGASTIRLSPDTHDELVCRSSHLPHLVAAELASYVLSPAHPPEQGLLCANGFRDTTRIASGSPEMWRDIALANHQNLARMLEVFIGNLQELQQALAAADEKALQEFFEQAKQRRDSWKVQTATSTSPE
jgi:prephenate dehydrogenase